ncbi:MAG: DUF3343 domain-containing protein [Oscillospiraceae bacterium]|nr:DUF3343 domain-containing protein [Oscillospiraceae bacterium]
MKYSIIISRSLTQAHQMADVCRRAGISAQLVRTPAVLRQGGCGSAVRVDGRDLPQARMALSRAGITSARIYTAQPGGGWQEVSGDLF